MVKNGSPAPNFTLADENGISRSLSDLRDGKPLLLLFYRGTFCPTAQRDLLDYANVYTRIKGVGADMVAISTASVEDSAALKRRLDLPFTVLTDNGFAVSALYSVYESEDGDGPQPHGEPALFILDVYGKIAYSQLMTGPKGLANPAEMTLVLLYMSQNGGRY